jgi:hypothetical protein
MVINKTFEVNPSEYRKFEEVINKWCNIYFYKYTIICKNFNNGKFYVNVNFHSTEMSHCVNDQEMLFMTSMDSELC